MRVTPDWLDEVFLHEADRTALRQGSSELSYGDLMLRVEELTQYLISLGLRPGGTAAIALPRSCNWIIAALAIMRVGAAYVPTDLAWPGERLRYVVADSGATILISSTEVLTKLSLDVPCVDQERDAGAISAAPAVARGRRAPDDLAYLIYTSGSTGLPKGVEITHRNLAHLIEWHVDAFSVGIEDRASHVAGPAFDAAGWEIWPYLFAGASVWIADDSVRTSPEMLQAWMVAERLSIGFVPTALAVSLIAAEWPSETALRFLLTGGDVLPSSPRLGLPFQVVNNYGPTECSVVATSGIIPPGVTSLPTIGKPISGATIYILDDAGAPVPDGVEGEILIGGRGVGRGYRNLPEHTRRSFIADPFSDTPDARAYRTGDRGVILPNQQISFRGRQDRQEQIRGQRVELDEIACVLNRHPGVAFGTVVTNTAGSQERSLTAYVLTEAGLQPSASDLQEFLLRYLPMYMIPAQFVQIDSVPLTANGKLDFAALPQPTAANALPMKIAQRQLSALEERLLQMVRELLNTKDVGVEDDFFLSGGHSLLGTQLVLRIRSVFGVRLTLLNLFEAATVERLSEKVEQLLVAELDVLSEEEVSRRSRS